MAVSQKISSSVGLRCVGALALGAVLVGCGGSDREADSPQQQQYQQQPGQYGQQQGQYGQQQQPPPGQQYPQQQQPTAQPAPQQQQPAPQQQQPAGPPGMAAPAAGQAQPIDATMAGPAQALITQMAASEAPAGAKPLGTLLVGNFGTGATLESQLTMQPGKCYTVVGAGLPNVTELNLQFVAVTPLPNMTPVLAQDQGTGAQAVLGQKPNCYKWALPFPATVKLVVTVAGGSGIAGAQVFEK